MKLKALLLALIISVNLVSLPVSANNVEVIDESFVSSAEFLEMLGVTEGIVLDDALRSVSRGEFASLVVNMTNMSITNVDDTGFDDVYLSSDFGDKIYSALALEIISPAADRLFRPDEAVTYEAAVKMTVAALGYNKYALAKGGYPAGYVSVASNLDILSSVDADFTLTDAINLIYNAITADVWIMDSISGEDITYRSEPGRNLLTENFDLTYVKGIATTAGVYSANFDYSSGENNLELSGKMFKCTVDGAEKYLGYELEAWYNNKKEIVVLKPTQNNSSVELDASEVMGFSSNKLTYATDDKEISYTMDSGYFFVLNGRYYNQSDSDFQFENGSLTLIDNNGDRKYDFVLAKKTEFFNVTAINDLDRTLYDSSQPGVTFTLSEDGDQYNNVKIYDLSKNTYTDADYDSIAVGNLLEVRKSYDNGLVEVSIITANVLSGTVDEIGSENIVIAGIPYELTEHFTNTGSKIILGQYAEFLLSSQGRIVSKNEATDKMKYAFFLGYSKDTSLSGTNQVKILTESNQVSVYKLSDKVKLNGTPYASGSSDIESALVIGNVPNYQLIKYSINSKGELSSIDTASSAPSDGSIDASLEGDNTLIRYVEKQEALYKSNGLMVPYGNLSGTKVFYVPADLATRTDITYGDEFFVCAGTTRLENDETPTVDIYDYNVNYVPGAAVVYNMLGGASSMVTPNSTAASYMVERVTQAVDVDGNVSAKLTLCNASTYQSYVINYDVYNELLDTGKIPNRGDIVRISLDHQNEINGLARDVEYNSATKTITINYGNGEVAPDNDVRGAFTYTSGKVVANGDKTLTVDVLTWGTGSRPTLVNNKMSYYCNVSNAVLYPGEKGQVRSVKIGDVMSETNYGEGNSDIVVMRINYFQTNTVFVYRNN